MAITTSERIRHRARITSQGQITVPKRVRDALEVGAGDELEFELLDNRAVIRPRRRRALLEFAGIAADVARRIPRSADELDEVIATAAREAAGPRG